ncbi:hypothetical protein BDQ17DRAFT_1301522 [Cyathus striatus]|nr:hypothetical protein BDQ17DRAFT_1301522 [Cyathus striatus]
MPWTDKTVIFMSSGVSDTETIKEYFYPLYLRILYISFPVDQKFILFPHCNITCVTDTVTPPSDDFIPFVIQTKIHKVVFFVQIHAPTLLGDPHERKQADNEMRNRFRQFGGSLQIPKLYGMCAFGTHICFYSYDRDTGAITPTPVENTDDTAPVYRWSLNILEEDGRLRLLNIVEEIQQIIRTN